MEIHRGRRREVKYKVISEKQPWAYLICSGIKDIENRMYKCPQKYIGQRVLIHAGAEKMKGIEGDYFNEDQIRHLYCGHTPLEELHKYHSMRELYSAIIGSVEIVDCVVNHPSIWAEKSEPIEFDEFGFPIKYDKKIYNWVLANPILFDKPILNVEGKMVFWDYDLPEEYYGLILRRE